MQLRLLKVILSMGFKISAVIIIRGLFCAFTPWIAFIMKKISD